MAASPGGPDLVPPLTTYREYYARDKTNPFTDDYAAVLSPYAINPTNTGAATEPRLIALQIYAAAHRGEPHGVPPMDRHAGSSRCG